MKAMVCTGLGNLQAEERHELLVAHDCIIIEITRVGICGTGSSMFYGA